MEDVYYFLSQIDKKKNIKLLLRQTPNVSFPVSAERKTPEPPLQVIAKKADLLYWRGKGIGLPVSFFVDFVWGKEDLEYSNPDLLDPLAVTSCRGVPSLQAMILQRWSIFNMAYGTINGRTKAIAANAGLFPAKWRNAVLESQRDVRQPVEDFPVAWKHVQTALDVFYYKMGVDRKKGTMVFPLSLDGLTSVYLGSSAGLQDGPDTKLQYEGIEVKVSPSGSKYEILESDIDMLIRFLESDNYDPACQYSLAAKAEMFFSETKQKSDEKFTAWLQKVRIFVIPSSLFVLMERVVSKARMMIERCAMIKIGHAWIYGGCDEIADSLGISALNEWKKILVEGDVFRFDQGVLAHFTDLYFGQMLYYDLPGTQAFKLRKKVCEWLARNLVQRMTHLFGEIWGAVIGGVPSGCFNTSHMDSWVMAMYFCLFGCLSIAEAPEDLQDKLMDALLHIVKLIVYGDDHAYNKTEDPVIAFYFSGVRFQAFMKKYFGVEIRDMFDGLAFLSNTAFGRIIAKGLTFLRHQMVLNPCKQEGQSRYLPYRETWEFIIRAFWGKEPRFRTAHDVLLSSIGHAYGTYAANEHAYECLKCVYQVCVADIGLTPQAVLSEIVPKLTSDGFKDLRRKGVSVEEMLNGFPSWQTLVAKNVRSKVYHSRPVVMEDLEMDDLSDY